MINKRLILLVLITTGAYFNTAKPAQNCLVPRPRFYFVYTNEDLYQTFYHDGGFLCYPKPQNDSIKATFYRFRFGEILDANLKTAKKRNIDQNIINYYEDRLMAECRRIEYDMQTRQYNLIMPDLYPAFSNADLAIPVYTFGLRCYPEIRNKSVSVTLYQTAVEGILQENLKTLTHTHKKIDRNTIQRYAQRIRDELCCNMYDF